MEAQRISGGVLPGPAGSRWFALVRYDARGSIARQFLMAPAGTDCDLSEGEALARWDDGSWPTGHVDAMMALQRAVAHGGECVRLQLPIGAAAGAYSDAAAATQAACVFAVQAELPPPIVVEVGGGVFAFWRFCAPRPSISYAETFRRLAALHGLRVDGVEVGEAFDALSEIMP